MSKKKANISIPHDLDVVYPERETGYVVTQSDWKRLRKRVEKIQSFGPTFLSLGCLLLGVGVTALFAVVTLLLMNVETAWRTVSWVVAISSLVSGGLLIYFYCAHQRNQESHTKEDAKECLDEIEEKFPQSTKV